ncbi:hypothetical protein C821_001658 [Lactobacillus intestinalis]|nr:hypothetical protein C821_001658 [Lactobacillus intestinalis]
MKKHVVNIVLSFIIGGGLVVVSPAFLSLFS